ncbi:MAG: PilZ domain-containing protein [Syntrophobacterales bacterium]
MDQENILTTRIGPETIHLYEEVPDMTTDKEKRQYPRVKVRWPVLLRTARGDKTGETLNITSNGAFIRCQESLGLDEVFELIIDVPALVQPITLTAKVIHETMNDPEDKAMPCEMGILFTEISEKQRLLISTAIQRESGVMLMP